MAVRHTNFAVTTTAKTLLENIRDTGLRRVSCVIIQNNSAAPMYVGGSGVTTSTFGYKLNPGDGMVLDLDPDDVPYIIAASSLTANLMYIGVDAT